VDLPIRQTGEIYVDKRHWAILRKRTPFMTRLLENRVPHCLMKKETCSGEYSKNAIENKFSNKRVVVVVDGG
jgi:hypothetical protein